MKHALPILSLSVLFAGCVSATRLLTRASLEDYLTTTTRVGADVSVAKEVIRNNHWKILAFDGCDISSDTTKEPKLLIVSTAPGGKGLTVVWTIESNQLISNVCVRAPDDEETPSQAVERTPSAHLNLRRTNK